MRVQKKHIGRPIDFKLNDGEVANGRVVAVRNGIASVNYWIKGAPQEGYTAYLSVRDTRIVEIY